MTRKIFLTLTVALVCAASAFAITQEEADAKAMKKYPSFLTASQLPNGVKYLPAPPDTSSVRFYDDWLQYNWGKSQRATERGLQAVFDSYTQPDSVLKGFAPALGGLQVTSLTMPETVKLVKYVISDACKACEFAKQHHFRKRPYLQMREGTLIPDEEASHVLSGSYPSNHSALGWATALVLVGLFPDCQDAILERGYQYGQSRVIAGYHYQSDVDASRMAASAAFARIQIEKAYQEQFAKARREVERARR